MSGVSSQSERKQLEEDIARIKSTLQHGSDVEILDDDDADADADGECFVIDETLDALPTSSTFTSNNEWDVASEASTSAKPVVAKRPSDDVPSKSSTKIPLPDAAVATENPALPQMCLALNKAYQEIILENLENIQQMIIRNRHKQEELQAELTNELANRNMRNASGQAKRMPLSFYGFPYFRDKAGLPQPFNSETKARQDNMEVDGYTRISKFYTNKEKKLLQRAVEEDKLKQKLRPFLARKELELEKVPKAKSKEEMDTAEERLESLEHRITDLRNTSEQIPFTEEEEQSIDWMKISIVDFDGQRDPDDIRLYWKNALHPSINKGRWRMSEDMNLAKVVEENGGRDWDKIAGDLLTKRTSFQCLQRFQMKLNPCLQTGKWTEDEDVFLKEVVESLTVNGHTPWDQVAYYMEGRSDEQCEARWRTHEDLKMGKWSPEEDQLLLTAVKRCGYTWAKVQESVPNRSAPQCRERYMNRFTDSHRSGVFSYVEDRILWQIVQEEGHGHWARIASCLPGRNDNACLQRYKILKLHETLENILRKPPFGPDVVDKLLKLRARNLVKPQASTKETAIIKRLERNILTLNHRISVLEKYQTEMGGFKMDSGLLYRDQARDRKIQELMKEREQLKCELNNVRSSQKQRQADIEDAEQMLSDRKSGVAIPVVLLGERVFGRSFIENNQANSRELLEKLDMRLKKIDAITRREGVLYHDESLNDLIINPDFKFKKKKSTKCKPKPKKDPAVKQELLAGTIVIGSVTLSPQKSRAKVRENRVNKDICALLGKRTPQPSKPGRPRNFYADEPGTSNTTEPAGDVESKVVKLFAKALNIDADGTKQRTQKLMDERGIDLTASSSPPAGKTSEDVESFRLRKHVHQLKDSLWPDLGESRTQGSDGTATSEAIEKIFPRWALRGPESTRAYNLPPLPPSVCSLRGFRSLVLDRKNLVKQTKVRGSPGPSSVKRPCPAESTPAAKYLRLEVDSQNLSGQGTCAVLQADKTAVDAVIANDSDSSTGIVEASGEPPVDTPPVPLAESSTSHVAVSNADEPASQASDSQKESGNPTSKTSKIPTVIIMKSAKLTKDAVTNALQSKGIHADPGKLHMQVMSKRDLEARLPGNTLLAGSPGQPKLTLNTLRGTHDYQLLKARFKSMFLWPALLSTINVPPRQTRAQGSESQTIDADGDSQADDAETATEVERDVKPLIVGAQGLASKQSKKAKTARNRYPCNYGRRARKINAMPRDKKIARVQKFKEARLRSVQKNVENEQAEEENEPQVELSIPDIDLPSTTRADLEMDTESANSLETLDVGLKQETESDGGTSARDDDNEDSMSMEVEDGIAESSCEDVPSPVPEKKRMARPVRTFVCDLRNVTAGQVLIKATEEYELEVTSRTVDPVVPTEGNPEICVAEDSYVESTSQLTNLQPAIVEASNPLHIKTSRDLSQPEPIPQVATPEPNISTHVAAPMAVVPQMLFENSTRTPQPTSAPSTSLLIPRFQTPQPARSVGVCKFFTPRQVQGVCRLLRPRQSPSVCKFFRPSKSPAVPGSRFSMPRGSRFPTRGNSPAVVHASNPSFEPQTLREIGKSFSGDFVSRSSTPDIIECESVDSKDIVPGYGSRSMTLDINETESMDSKEVMYVIVKDEASDQEMRVPQSSVRERATAINGQFSTYTQFIDRDPTGSNS